MKVKVGDKTHDGHFESVMLMLKKGEGKRDIVKVKVEDKVYDYDKTLVRVLLSKGDKKNIANMLPECTRYCEYPEEKYTVEDIKKWMLDPPKEDWEL